MTNYNRLDYSGDSRKCATCGTMLSLLGSGDWPYAEENTLCWACSQKLVTQFRGEIKRLIAVEAAAQDVVEWHDRWPDRCPSVTLSAFIIKLKRVLEESKP